MKKEHPLIQVARVLDAKRPAPSGSYTLYVDNKKIGLYESRLVPKSCPILARLNARGINNGLTSKTWQAIEDRIQILRKRGLLWPQPQKH